MVKRPFKSVALGAVGLLVGGCCVLGAIGNAVNPKTSAKIPAATLTAQKTATALRPSPTAVVIEATATAVLLVPTETLAPVVVPTKAAVQPTAVIQPTAAAVAPAGDSFPCQPGQIKANIESNKYHVPSGQSYARTVKSVICFDTAQEAEAAGFVRSKR